MPIFKSTFPSWLTTAWTNLLSWFGVGEQKFASFLYPVFKNSKELLAKDFVADVIACIPVVAIAFSGGYDAMILAAEEAIIPLLKAQGAELARTDIEIFKNGLVAQATIFASAAAPAAPSSIS